MPLKEIGMSSFCIKNIETGEKIVLENSSIIEGTINQPDCEENSGKSIYNFNKEYYEKPFIFSLETSYWDLSKVYTNNWRRMHGMKLLPYRKLFKYSTKYALTIYNKQRKYIRNKYTFEEWKIKKGID